MFKRKNILLLIPFTMFITSMLVILNSLYIDIRLEEMQTALMKFDRNENNVDHIALVTRYRIHEKLYLKKLSKNEADRIEFQVSRILLQNQKAHHGPSGKTGFFYQPALMLINTGRYFLSKPPIGVIEITNDTNEALDLAYFYENNNLFQKAYSAYHDALKADRIDPQIKASILLHQGYCLALSGRYSRAGAYYQKVISGYPMEDVAITAAILLSYLKTFQKEYSTLNSKNITDFAMGEKLFTLMHFKEALHTLNQIEKKGSTDQQTKIKYFKARCYSYLGQTEKAVQYYLELIISSPQSRYARLSNRRLFLIGSRIDGDNEIKKLAVKINQKLRDSIIDTMLLSDPLTDIKNGRKLPSGPLKIKKSTLAEISKFLNFKQPFSLAGKEVIVTTKDGSRFIGIVMSDKERILKINTIIGEVKLKKNRIKKVKIKSKL